MCIILVLCGWCNVWNGLRVVFNCVLVWEEVLSVPLNEKVSSVFRGTEGGLDNARTVVIIVFSTEWIIIWPLWLVC